MPVFPSCHPPPPSYLGNTVVLYSPWRENIFQKLFFPVFPILFKVSTICPLSPLSLWVRSSSLLGCPLYYFPLTFGITLFQSLQYIPIRYIFSKHLLILLPTCSKPFEWLPSPFQIKDKCLIFRGPSQSNLTLYFQIYLSLLLNT